MKNTPSQKQHLASRKRAEKRFRLYGLSAIICTCVVLFVLLISLFVRSLPAFHQHYVLLQLVPYDETTSTRTILRESLFLHFPNLTERRDKSALSNLLSIGAFEQLEKFLASENISGSQAKTKAMKTKIAPADKPNTTKPNRPNTSTEKTNTSTAKTEIESEPKTSQEEAGIPFLALLSDDVDLFLKRGIDVVTESHERRLSDKEVSWIKTLYEKGLVKKRFAWHFFTKGDSSQAELAGLGGALIGSALTILVTFLFSFPIGLAAAIYLQELAPKNKITDLIEVNISNLAAVPSIVFGLLGLVVFIGFFNLPRSAPLVGGLVLSLMTLPVIVIATRAALAAVPHSIRQAALSVGASRVQTIFHHIVPEALPGILTGTIIGLARAAGETAPLLMIGMIAFIVDIPTKIVDKASVLPAQIYIWSNNPERAFMAKTSAAIVVLLGLLLVMNGLAIYLRKKYERRW